MNKIVIIWMGNSLSLINYQSYANIGFINFNSVVIDSDVSIITLKDFFLETSYSQITLSCHKPSIIYYLKT